MLTKGRGPGTIFASTETEFTVGHEVLWRRDRVSLKIEHTIFEEQRTVHSWICASDPNALENTKPPMGFPEIELYVNKDQIRTQHAAHMRANHITPKLTTHAPII